MEIKSEAYRVNLNCICKDIFKDQLEEIIDELSGNAKFFMSSDIDASTTDKINTVVVDLLKNGKYQVLPLHMVSEAFTRGSMGELGGTTRYTVRNMCVWLNEMYDKLRVLNANRYSQVDAERRKEEEANFKTHKEISNMYGAAFRRKVECFCNGSLNPSEWEQVSLDKMVDLLKEGHAANDIMPKHVMK